MWRHVRSWALTLGAASLAGSALLAGSDANRAQPPIIWLHYDYMVGSDGHSHAPAAQSLELVAAAFRARGLTLHIDPRHTEIPESEILVFGPVWSPPACPAHAGRTAVWFEDLKAQYFHARGSQPWHYVVFGHYGEPSGAVCNLVSGSADVGGYDFMVTMALSEESVPGLWARFRPYWEGGVLMHELGHNLGLLHGGDEWTDHKPNYFSVMNSEGAFGILVAAAPGSTTTIGLRIDYSDEALPTLDEAALDERAGLGGAPDNTDIARVLSCEADPFGAPLPPVRVPSTGPIDWNCNGVIETAVARQITLNHLEAGVPPGYAVLRGFDDWAHIQQWLRTPAYLSGTLRSQGVVP